MMPTRPAGEPVNCTYFSCHCGAAAMAMNSQTSLRFCGSIPNGMCRLLLAPPVMTGKGSCAILSDDRISGFAFCSVAHTHGPSRRNAALPSMKSCRATAEFVPGGAYDNDLRNCSIAATTPGSVKLYLLPLSQSCFSPSTQVAASMNMLGCSAVVVASPNWPLSRWVVLAIASSHSDGVVGTLAPASGSGLSL